MKPRTISTAMAIAAAAVALIGCSSSSSSTTTTPRSAAPTTTSAPATATHSAAGTSAQSKAPKQNAAMITIDNYAYRVTGTVMPGATVRIKNDDSTTHTVTADSGHGFDVTVDAGKSATLTAPQARGAYKFHCDFHAEMHGTLTVK